MKRILIIILLVVSMAGYSQLGVTKNFKEVLVMVKSDTTLLEYTASDSLDVDDAGFIYNLIITTSESGIKTVYKFYHYPEGKICVSEILVIQSSKLFGAIWDIVEKNSTIKTDTHCIFYQQGKKINITWNYNQDLEAYIIFQ